LFELAGRLGAKQALRDIGMSEDGIEQAVKATLAVPYWNPRPLEEAALRSLLTRAWNGDPPQA
jgi:alcohol dehydrogenase class IV